LSANAADLPGTLVDSVLLLATSRQAHTRSLRLRPQSPRRLTNIAGRAVLQAEIGGKIDSFALPEPAKMVTFSLIYIHSRDD
jgi:hypothetical protein